MDDFHGSSDRACSKLDMWIRKRKQDSKVVHTSTWGSSTIVKNGVKKSQLCALIHIHVCIHGRDSFASQEAQTGEIRIDGQFMRGAKAPSKSNRMTYIEHRDRTDGFPFRSKYRVQSIQDTVLYVRNVRRE